MLKSSLKRAVALGIAEKEYTDCIVRPKQREKQVECFSKDEKHKIEQNIYEKKKTKLFGIMLCFISSFPKIICNNTIWSDSIIGGSFICLIEHFLSSCLGHTQYPTPPFFLY